MPKQKTREEISELAKDAEGAMISTIDLRDIDALRAVIDAIPGVEVRAEPLDKASETDPQTDNLVRWRLSEWPEAWVNQRNGRWNHEDWLELIGALADSEYWPIRLEGVGCVLEEEAGKLNQRTENLNRWKSSGLPREWVAARNGEWCHDDWSNLIGVLEGTEFWPMNPEQIGLVLEGLRGSIEIGDASADGESDADGNREVENLARWLDSGLPQIWLDERNLEWNHDDWTNLIASLSETEFWPMEPAEIGRVLEELKGSRLEVREGSPRPIEAVQDSVGDDHMELANLTDRDQESTVRLLVACGADVNAKDSLGQTPMHRAASEGREEVVRVLSANGADVNATTNEGRTALHLAAAGHHQSVVNLLLACGAEINVADEYGVTPLHLSILAEDSDAPSIRTLASTPAMPVGLHNGARPLERNLAFQSKNGKAGDELG